MSPAKLSRVTVPDRRRRARAAPARAGRAGAAPARRDVLRFRVELEEVAPAVYRRIEVPAEYTFWDLHVAIQDAMGWTDSHLHEFELTDPVTRRRVRIGIPDDELPEERPAPPGWTVPIAPFFGAPGTAAEYLYDFGDDWHHTVVFEGTQARQACVRYPRCIDGARACPPEDVGGPGGYEQLLAVLADPAHEEHDAMLEWAGGAFDPAHFSPADVHFDDPRVRWRLAFGPR